MSGMQTLGMLALMTLLAATNMWTVDAVSILSRQVKLDANHKAPPEASLRGTPLLHEHVKIKLPQDRLEAMKPMLEKLRGLDPKSFGILSKILGQAAQGVSLLQTPSNTDSAQSRLEALQPVLEKLRGLDPKSFGMLSNMLGQAGTSSSQPAQGVSLLQTPSSADSTESRLEALQPVLEKLRGLDPKSFGMLSNMLGQAGASSSQPAQGVSLLQTPSSADSMESRLEALQPVLEKLRGLDPKSFGMLSSMLGQAGASSSQPAQGVSLLQTPSSADSAQSRLEALQPVLEKLRGLDPKSFGMLSNMLGQAGTSSSQPAQGVSLLQTPSSADSAQSRLEALQPVLEKLRGLDPKSFGMLSNMLGQAGASSSQQVQGVSLLQTPSNADSAQSRLEALQPVLEKLRGLDPKSFGMLSNMLGQAGTSSSQPAQGVSLLQTPSNADSTEGRLEALQPVLEKLRGLDPKSFGMLSNMLGQAGASSSQPAQGVSLLQTPSSADSTESRLEALQPVLEKLRGLDPKSFGMLSNMLGQAGTSSSQPAQGVSLLQTPSSADSTQSRLEALQPVLEKLRGLDPKSFGMLSNMLGQAGTASKL